MRSEWMRIRREHHLTSQQGAKEAGVPLRIEELCEIGVEIEEEAREKIVQAMQRLTGCDYTREQLGIAQSDALPPLAAEETLKMPIVRHKSKSLSCS